MDGGGGKGWKDNTLDGGRGDGEDMNDPSGQYRAEQRLSLATGSGEGRPQDGTGLK